MKKERYDVLAVLIPGVVLSWLTYIFVLSELKGIYADFNGHTYVYLPMFRKETWIKGWMMVPYCMWHLVTLFFHKLLLIPIQNAAAYTTCLFTLFAYFVMVWMIRKVTEAVGCGESLGRAGLIAFGMCLLQPLYFDWLDAGGRFLGSFSMNPIHNPTYMCMRGFSLVCFGLILDIWGRQKSKDYKGIFFRVERGLKPYYIYMTVMLFLSVLAKPTFAEMFIPAVALVMLGEWIARIRRKDGSAAEYFGHCLRTLLCAVPALLYILVQFLAYFIWGGSYGSDGSLVVTNWLEVWHMFTQNVGLSVGLGLAFPLFLVLINGGYFIRSDWGRLALTGYGVGFLEAALLGEGGGKMSHGDFLWPMMSGMLLLYVTALLRLLVLERTEADTKGRRLWLSGAWFLFCIHVMYGLLYIKDMLG